MGGETWECLHHCGERVRRVVPEDGIDTLDFKFIHVEGGPYCDFTPIAWPDDEPEPPGGP